MTTSGVDIQASVDKALADIAAKQDAAREHKSPCSSKACLDLECQVEILAVSRMVHLVEHVSSKWTTQFAQRFYAEFLKALDRFINNPKYGLNGPDEVFEATWEYCEQTSKDWTFEEQVQTHVQIEKPVLEAPAKAVRKPRTKKHAPRTTDDKEHPVTVTQVSQEPTVTITQSVLEETINRMAQERAEAILAAKAQQPDPIETPVQIVGQTAVVQIPRIGAAEREAQGVVLGEIKVDKSLTVPALVLGDVSLDTIVPSSMRSPYNKARYRLEHVEEVLSKDTTYRALAIEHARLAQVAKEVKAARKEAKKQQQMAVALDPALQAKVQAVVTATGLSVDKATALVMSL